MKRGDYRCYFELDALFRDDVDALKQRRADETAVEMGGKKRQQRR